MAQDVRRRDQGSVLPIALILVVVLGAVTAALAGYTATALRTSAVTTDIVDRLAAAESGMQAELAKVDGGACDLATPRGVINRAVVTTTCTNRTRVENADGAYALVITGERVDSGFEFTTDGPARKCVGGPIYFEAGITVDLNNMAAVSGTDCDVSLANAGEVRFNLSGGCPTTPVAGPAAGDWLAPEPTYACDARGWEAIAPAPDVSSTPRSSLVTMPPAGGTPQCRTYQPGIMAGGTLDLGDSFLGSGVYYFENVTININGRVTAGKRTDGVYGTDYAWASSDTYDSDCVVAQALDLGTGATLILGGSSTFSVNNGGRLGIYPRDLTVGPASRGVSVISFDSVTDGYLPSSIDPDGAPLIDRHNGSNRSASFYGLTYVPRSFVDTGNAAGGAYIQFVGGLVAAKFSLRTEPPVGAFSMFVPSSLVDYYLLTSVAEIDGNVTTVRTVGRIGDAGGVEVLTWRAS